MKTVPIVFLADENYIVPTVVAIQSLIEKFDFDNALEIIILGAGENQEKFEIFHDFKREKVNISIIPMDSFSTYNESGYYVSSTALYKCMIPGLIPQYDKILYIDGDTIIQGNVAELFDFDINDYYVAAVSDIAAVEQKWDKRLGLDNYFNSGVLLFNAKKYRDDNIEDLFWKTKKEHPEYMCMDQDVFNDVFQNHVLYLSPVWNLMRYNIELLKKEIEQVNEFYNVEYESLDELENDAKIIHLTNKFKPWIYREVYKSFEWMEIYERSPMKECPVKLISPEEPTGIEKEYFEINKIGFLRKESTIYETVVYLGKLPLFRKVKTATSSKYKLFNFSFSFLAYYFDDFEYMIKILGIPVWRNNNEEGIVTRLISSYSSINSALDKVCRSVSDLEMDSILDVEKIENEIRTISKMENK